MSQRETISGLEIDKQLADFIIGERLCALGRL